MPHDTRKSDVWSLGVTFFEILMGRTPFEHSEGEQFTTKEDLEMYWNRTVRVSLARGAAQVLNALRLRSSAASGSARGRCRGGSRSSFVG